MGTHIIYDFRSNPGFVLREIFPEAVVIPAGIKDNPRRLMKSLSADTKFFSYHLDITDFSSFPNRRARFNERLRKKGIVVLNGEVTSISKRNIQALFQSNGINSARASREGDSEELLIVKSDYNHGANTERNLSAKEREALKLPEIRETIPKPLDYSVLKRRDLDPAAWRLPGIVIERYISNDMHLFFRVYLLGKALVVSRVINPALIKKMYEGIERSNLFLEIGPESARVTEAGYDPPPGLISTILATRRCLKLDFGAMDVVVDNSLTPFVVDVNATPYWGAIGQEQIITFLRSGIPGSGTEYHAFQQGKTTRQESEGDRKHAPPWVPWGIRRVVILIVIIASIYYVWRCLM